jgi:hypothetical protein
METPAETPAETRPKIFPVFDPNTQQVWQFFCSEFLGRVLIVSTKNSEEKKIDGVPIGVLQRLEKYCDWWLPDNDLLDCPPSVYMLTREPESLTPFGHLQHISGFLEPFYKEQKEKYDYDDTLLMMEDGSRLYSRECFHCPFHWDDDQPFVQTEEEVLLAKAKATAEATAEAEAEAEAEATATAEAEATATAEAEATATAEATIRQFPDDY